jgi:hypothetical protein
VEIFSSIWVQLEKHTLRQEVPPATTDTHDDLQETHDNSQEAPNVPQEAPNVMTLSWRDLQFDAEADTQVENHFCGNLDKDPSKPSRAVLFQLLLKEKVASGRLIIDGIVDGVPVIVRAQSGTVDGRPPAFRSRGHRRQVAVAVAVAVAIEAALLDVLPVTIAVPAARTGFSHSNPARGGG